MNILIADRLPEAGLARLTAAGFEVTANSALEGDSLAAAISETRADVLVVRSTRVHGRMLERGDLKLIVRAGSGFDTIDVDAASARGILVANCPGMNSVAVAELAFGLILALDRRIPDNVQDLKEGRWNKAEYSRSPGLAGRTLGLIGLGSIGRQMISRAQAFGMPVVAWSRSLTHNRADRLAVEMKSSPIEVAASSDVVSVHVALADDTQHLIGEDFFAAMCHDAYFINTSRSGIVDESALIRAVKSKGLRVGLDVFEGEPSGGTGSFESVLFDLPGVIGTHHIGASTEQAQNSIADETCRIIIEFSRTGRPPHLVGSA